MFNKLFDYFRGVRSELKNVKWPTRKQATNVTILVIGVSLAVAIFLGLFDMLFGYLVNNFLI